MSIIQVGDSSLSNTHPHTPMHTYKANNNTSTSISVDDHASAMLANRHIQKRSKTHTLQRTLKWMYLAHTHKHIFSCFQTGRHKILLTRKGLLKNAQISFKKKLTKSILVITTVLTILLTQLTSDIFSNSFCLPFLFATSTSFIHFIKRK